MLNWAQITEFIHANPAVSAATAGMLLSTGYILLMVATKLGDVKPGVQAFVLSSVLHIVIVALWGSLAISGQLGSGSAAGNSDGEELIVPISAVVVSGSPDGSDIPATEGSRGKSNNSLFNRIPTKTRDGFSRLQSASSERVSLEEPERNTESLGESSVSLPDLAMDASVVDKSVTVVEVPDPSPKAALGSSLEIGEDTAEANTQSVLTSPARTRSSPVEGPGRRAAQMEARRESRVQANESQVKVSIAPPAGESSNQGAETTSGDRPSKIEITQRRTGTAPAEVDPDAADLAEPTSPDAGRGTGDSKVPGASTAAGRFSRASPAALGGTGNRGSVSPTAGAGTDPGIARRVQEFTSDRKSTTPRIAMAAPGDSTGAGATTDRPGVTNPDFDTVPSRRKALTSETYKFRNPRQRQKVALKHGATSESEKAVELSLRWLARHQHPEGFWDADGFDAQCPPGDRCWGSAGRGNPTEVQRVNSPHDRVALETAGQNADTGLTALVVLTFLGAGYTQEEGQYADQIDRALRWLIRQQLADGYLGGKASHYEKMYCHGMVTYALGEACGMMVNSEQDDPQLRAALAKAVRYIVSMQNPRDGGWRYLDGHLANQESDMSMFGWQLMALKSAEIAGIGIPDKTRSGMELFLQKIGQGKDKGLASYRVGEQVKPAMTAEALFCRQVLGQRRDSPASLESIEFLKQHPPKQETQDLYHWYYGTLATYQYGGEPWEEWNSRLRDTLVATQKQTGHAAGSWEPRDNWSRHGGRLYSTALSTMCLEVYYRFLPLYQSQDRQSDL